MREPASTLDTVFTFFTEKEGSTIIEQFAGKSVREAILIWRSHSQAYPGAPLEADEPVPVDTVSNVWCISGLDPEGRLYLTHIVATTPVSGMLM